MKNDQDVTKLIEENAVPFSSENEVNDEKQENNTGKKRLTIVKSFDMIDDLETEWLWHNKLPAGELCLLSGLAGQGKTFWTCYLAAMVFHGWNWPDDSPCPKGNVLFFRGEDSIEKTVKPTIAGQRGRDVKRHASR